jgi:YHS domain-containing protein
MNRASLISRAIGLVLALFAAVLLSTAARAGEFFEKDGVAMRGYDVVSYFTDKKPVQGSADLKFEYKGSTFHFSSQANLDAFSAKPEQYAPQYGGFCAFGTAGGYKAATDPAAFTVVDSKLYLNYDKNVQKDWSADIPGFIAKADKNWPDVSKLTDVYE